MIKQLKAGSARAIQLAGRPEVLHFFSYYAFTLLSALVGFVSVPYLTRHIEPTSYGMIGIFTAIVFFMPALLSFSSNGLQAINIVDLDSAAYLEYRNTYLSFIILLSVIATACSVVLGSLLSEYRFVIVSAVIYGALQLTGSVHSTELIQHRKPVAFGILNFLSILLAFLISVLFISGFGWGWQARIYAMIVAEGIVLIVRMFFASNIGRSFRFRIHKPVFMEFIYFGWPLMISVMAGWLINQSDRFILLHYMSLKEVGLYAAAASVSGIIATFNQTMIKVVAPLVYQKLNKRTGKSFILKVNALYGVAILVIAALGCLLLHFGWRLFLGAEYGQSLPIIYILCFAQAFFGIYMTLGIIIDYFKQNKLKTIIIWVSAIVSLCLSIALIPAFKIYAPAIASLTAFMILAIITYVAGNNILKNNNIL